MRTLDVLTPEDQAWLAAERRRIASRGDFLIARFRGASGTDLRDVAKNVLLNRHGTNVPAHVLIAQTLRDVRPSQIYEQWDYDAACAIDHVARSLCTSDAEILMIASGYTTPSIDQLADAAGEAVSEAWSAMYGEPDDEEFDFD
jgi:hypothetical protein